MKWNLALVLVTLTLFTTPGYAGLSDIQLSATRLKLDETKSRADNVTTTEKEVAYEVTVQNKGFKTFENVQIKYAIYYEDAKGGEAGAEKEKAHRGTETIAALNGNQKLTFNTTPLILTTESLDAGWTYGTGANSRARDRTKGLWIRAYVNGQVVGEYMNPSTVGKKPWKD